MENNPYAPPKTPVADQASSDAEPTVASAPLYSSVQMAVATFLGSAMAGAWLASANFKAIGQPLNARRILWFGVAVAVVTVAIGFVLPEKFPSYVLPLAVAFGAKGLAETRFGAILRDHLKRGGVLRSWWRVVGISLLIAAAVFALVMAGLFTYELAVETVGRQ